MEQEFDVILTGSDGPVEGVARKIPQNGHADAYDFQSLDGTIHLIVAKQDGEWVRIGGTDPYFTGWPDELIDQISQQDLL